MVTVRAFSGIRPRNPQSFCIKPYDVIDEEELMVLRKHDNAIHIILPEGEGEEVYENAEKAFHETMANTGYDEPSIYLYRESNAGFSQRGFIFTVPLEDYADGHIKKHEETREKPLKDRIKHIEGTKANTGLVWTMFRSHSEIKGNMDQIMQEKPLEDFEKYGYRHQLWRITDGEIIERIRNLFKHVDLYIADGHHRIRAAYDYSQHHNEDEAKYVMVFAASDDELRILAYNRVITIIDRPDFIDALSDYFKVAKLTEITAPHRLEIQMFFNGEWWQLTPKEIPIGLVASLDVSILQNQLLEPILSITDIRNDPRIFFVGGNVSRKEYERLVEKGGNAAAFYLHPTSIEELEAISDKCLSMPPKSTWFEPKLLTGLVFHSLR